MPTKDDVLRYSRHLLLDDIGEVGQQKLCQAKVMIIGLGGLGCPAASYLTAAGVGQLHLVDGDKIEISNLQRQTLYSTDDKGQQKAIVAGQKLEALNPTSTIHSHNQFFDESFPLALFAECDLVLDCTDNLTARKWINKVCHQHKIPLLSAAAIRWEGQLSLFDFSRSATPCYQCLWAEGAEEPLLNCSSSGVVGPVLGILGSMQALEAIKYILGVKTDLSGTLKSYDGKRGQWLSLAIPARANCPVCGNSE